MKHPINPLRWLLASATFIASMLLFASTANALTMTFDDTVDYDDTDPSSGVKPGVLPYEEDGLRLTSISDKNALFDSRFHRRTDRPTDFFGWMGDAAVLETVSGNPFSLTSFQYGNEGSGDLLTIQVLGFFNGGGIAPAMELLSVTGDPWATHSFSSAWTNLQSVWFASDRSAAIDSIMATEASGPDSGSVPIPDSGSALTMLGCSILGLAWLRRKLG